jgi:hypothetical protein
MVFVDENAKMVALLYQVIGMGTQFITAVSRPTNIRVLRSV